MTDEKAERIGRACGIVTGWILMGVGLHGLLGWPGPTILGGFWLAIPARYIRP